MNNMNDCVFISAEVALTYFSVILSKLKIKTLLVKKQNLVFKITNTYD